MLAGRLQEQGRAPKSLLLLAPGTVIKDYALEGKFLGVECDPVDPPEYVQVQWYKFGRKYIKTAQTLPIFEEAGKYTGHVCIIHGSEDLIVPFRYGEEMKGIYSDCTLHRISGDGHLFLAKLRKVESLILKFLGRQ